MTAPIPIPRLDRDVELENLKAASPDDLRALGWSLVAHYDSKKGRHELMWTRWVFTYPGTDRFVSGEGYDDAQALGEIREKLEGGG